MNNNTVYYCICDYNDLSIKSVGRCGERQYYGERVYHLGNHEYLLRCTEDVYNYYYDYILWEPYRKDEIPVRETIIDKGIIRFP